MSKVILGRYDPREFEGDGSARALAALHRLNVHARRNGDSGGGGGGFRSSAGRVRHVFHRHSTQVTMPEWPESSLPWPEGAIGVLATGNEMKVLDNDDPLRPYGFRVVSHTLMLGGSPDSMEREDNAAAIARAKVRISIEEPWEELIPGEQAQALAAIGAQDERHIVLMAEDRELKLDPRFRNSEVWDDVRDLPLVCEAFDAGHLFPGKRINELVNAVGGVVNFLDRMDQVRREHAARGITLDEEHSSYVTYFLKPMKPGLLPLPEDGMYITAVEHGRVFRPLTEEDRLLEENGYVVELDHFDVPRDFQGIVDTRGQMTYTVEALRHDRETDYFVTDFPSARAMVTLAQVANIPTLPKPREHRLEGLPGARILTNDQLGEYAATPAPGTQIGGYDAAAYASAIGSHADLEQAFSQSEGTVIRPISAEDAPPGVDPELYVLTRKLEALCIFSNRAALKPLADDSAFGRPVIVHSSVARELLGWWYDAAKFRTVSHRPDHVIKIYDEEDELEEILAAGWEMDKYRPNPEQPHEFRLMTREELTALMGVEDLGYVNGQLGSATSHIPSGNDDALDFTRWASQAGMTNIHGGGSRYIMRRFVEGSILEGGESLNIGIRVPVASRKEGSLRPLLREHGLELDAGCEISDAYYSFEDGRFHVITTDEMGERQHIVMGASDSVTLFIGGAGSGYEVFMTAYHNLMVETRGHGIFPGQNNQQKIDIDVVNSEVQNGAGPRGYFDTWFTMFSPEQQALMGIHVHDTARAAFQAKYERAALQGHDLNPVPELGLDADQIVRLHRARPPVTGLPPGAGTSSGAPEVHM